LTWLSATASRLHPSFANEVFVVLTEMEQRRSVAKSIHFQAFASMMDRLDQSRQEPSPAEERKRTTVYLGNNLALTHTVHGHKMYVDTRDVSLAPHILLDGKWEDWITAVFRRLVRPGMNVVDIGANMGWYSVIAADLIGQEGKLVSFEANPALKDIVFRNLMINGFFERSKVESKAVYSDSRQMEFLAFQKYLGASSFFVTPELASQFGDAVEVLKIDTVSLDDYFPKSSRVDFVKIDAEGAEPHILKGSVRVLSENPDMKMMLEFAPQIFASSFGSVEDFYSMVRSLGFSVWRVQHDGGLIGSSLQDLSSITHCDIVLSRNKP
jgi:FkbM family methyltransferase